MKERSPVHQESSSPPTSIFRKTKTGEVAPATPSGLNANFTQVPASTGAIQRAAMEEGGGGEGSVMLTEGALAMLPPDVLANLGDALGGEAGETVKSYTRGKRSEFSAPSSGGNAKHARTVFSKDVENPRHIVDRSESDKTGFDREGHSDPKGVMEETAGSIRQQLSHTTSDSPDDYR